MWSNNIHNITNEHDARTLVRGEYTYEHRYRAGSKIQNTHTCKGKLYATNSEYPASPHTRVLVTQVRAPATYITPSEAK